MTAEQLFQYRKAETERERRRERFRRRVEAHFGRKRPWWSTYRSPGWFTYYVVVGTMFLGFGMQNAASYDWLRISWFALSAWDLWCAIVISLTFWEPQK